ncbi:ATP-dependent zinc metalloprotease FtsH [Peptoniphilus equinus]|uniref:ATP-dependent zinc metalloprotease FtsH n=2 Tax=Peptoniphilus equinus TaxID=3016343 RepID=A0ABY7QVE8_9FIRM|nr:ATP-dependent zinc metalloprotease FtsH [Peptoniphilus equinus]WBW50763.1 ATP-dependent zinc metalloprotease FtsH [Peptoniphilus equinus]
MINPKDESVATLSYDQLVEKVNQQEVKEVSVQDKKYTFTLKSDDDQTYVTNRMENDEGLINSMIERGVKVNRDFPIEIPPVLSMLLSFLYTFLMLGLLYFIFAKFVMKKFGGGVGPMSFGKSNAKIYQESTDGITFQNVAGQDEAKEALTEIVDFLHQPKKYTQIGARLPKGALLVGPPGTGKTLLAKAVAGEAKVPFFSISGSEFVEMFVGLGAAKVRDLFKQAHEKAPCIIFIDEIDTIGKKRDGAGFGGNDEREQTLNQLLSEMDGFEGNDGVVILAATNRPESLDPALLRPGRFDRRVPVELPDLAGREAILKVHAKDIKKEPEIDFNQIARATAGASGADLANMINEGALRAVREGRHVMSQRDVEESVEVVLAGYERKNAVISPREKEIIAYHEVGHALVAAKQAGSAPVHKITIVPRTSGALGYTMQVDEEEKFLMSKEDLFNQIVTLTGGRSAEELIFNSRTTGASNDIEKATRIAKAMITRFGMSDEFGFVAMEQQTNKYLGGDSSISISETKQSEVDDAVYALIEKAHETAINILKDNIDVLHNIARYLLKEETITGEQFMDILNRHDCVSTDQAALYTDDADVADTASESTDRAPHTGDFSEDRATQIIDINDTNDGGNHDSSQS